MSATRRDPEHPVGPESPRGGEEPTRADVAAPRPGPAAAPEAGPRTPRRTIAGATWTALVIGALLLILLLVFILQNQQAIELTLFAWTFTFPAGVGFLLAAIVGALIMALAGGVRMFQLRREVSGR